ncbi:MAG: GNAT family N-acetyltransferase [Algibacter sp.]
MTKTPTQSSYTLTHHNISNSIEQIDYKNVLKDFQHASPLHSLQYFGCTNKKSVGYFILKTDDHPKILMPICLREIKNELLLNEQYFDATSPYGYSGPLYNNATDQEKVLFWQEVDLWYKKNNVVTEFIRFNLNNNHNLYSGHLLETLSNVKGRIKSFDDIWGNFKQKVRNNYRKAEKSNLIAKIHEDDITANTVGTFFDIYTKTMQRNAAEQNYFYTKSYFEDLIKYNQGKIIIIIIYKENTPISAELIIIDSTTMLSHLGGTLSEYFDLRPNDFLKIEAIKWGIKNNKTHYSLGGGRTDNDGLYQYKKTFFPKDEDVTFYTGRKIINYNIYNKLTKQPELNTPITNINMFFPAYNKYDTLPEKNDTNIKLITSKTEWSETLNQVDNYDFYHTFDYHELSKQEGEKIILLKYTENESIICIPLIIRRIENTTYFDATSVYGYSGPLMKNINENFNNSEFVTALNQYFHDNNIVSVFSRLNPYINNQDFTLVGMGEILNLGNVVNIDLTKPLEEQRALYSKSTKSRTNKIRKNCDVIVSNKKEDIEHFIDIYSENMDRVNAKDMYYFPKTYYYDLVNSKDYDIDILFALHKETNEYACAAMMVKTNNIIQYHISGTKNEYLNLSPIRLLIDEMRVRATNEKYIFFNLGGGLGNNEDELFKFKSSFSKDFKPFKVWKYIANTKIYDELVENKELSKDISFFPLYRYNE